MNDHLVYQKLIAIDSCYVFLIGVIQNQQNYVVYVLNRDKNREKGAKWGDRREKKQC